MATFTINAYACEFGMNAGLRTRQHIITAPPIARHTVDCRTCDEVQAAMEALRSEVQTEGSFFISPLLKAGRAPAGYRNRNFLIEVDRDAGYEAR